MEWQTFLFKEINSLALKNIFLDEVAIFSALYLPYLVGAFLFLFWLSDINKRTGLVFRSLLAALFSRFVLVEIIYYIWPQPRPSLVYPVQLLLENPPSPAFPSGHAAFFFALSFYFFLVWIKKSPLLAKQNLGLVTVLLFLASIVISLARVVSGLHFPFDILNGCFVAFFSAWLVNKLLA